MQEDGAGGQFGNTAMKVPFRDWANGRAFAGGPVDAHIVTRKSWRRKMVQATHTMLQGILTSCCALATRSCGRVLSAIIVRASTLWAGVVPAALLGVLILGSASAAPLRPIPLRHAKWRHPGAVARAGQAAADYRLANSFDPGTGRGSGSNAKSWAVANYWYRKAAELGDPAAQYRLARDYARGLGLKRDYGEAVYWYRKAAVRGNAYAQVNLAIAYANGISVKPNPAKVVYWFRRAAEQGNAIAQNNLGVAYDIGRGVAKNLVIAVRWFRRAARQGNVRAEFNLANAYFLGQGVAKDERKAKRWYGKAAAHGDTAARRQLDRLRGGK